LGSSAAPLATVAERALGSGGLTLLSSIALFATTNTVLIILIAGARILYGMASDRSLPSPLGKIHLKTKTPWIAVIGIMLASMAFAFVGDIVFVANISVFAIVITFAMVNLAVIILRYTEPTIERPFRVPFSIRKFPILPLVGLGFSIYMGFQFELPVLAVGGIIIATGVLFYFIYNKRKKKLDNIQ
jgi:APA family basic amino acid/polyamine antiporter